MNQEQILRWEKELGIEKEICPECKGTGMKKPFSWLVWKVLCHCEAGKRLEAQEQI